MALTGCSRTVTWEEEVPLNTGEIIWIKRSMPWTLKGGFGNPFDIGMRPTWEQVIRFNYGGKDYSYSGRADVTWIAISPISNAPVLVAPASSFGWDAQNRFYCVVPHYVQLVPDATGNQWTWPTRIEPWLYGMPANVMKQLPSSSARYSAKRRDERDATYRLQFPSGASVNPQYKEDGCTTKFEGFDAQHKSGQR